MMIQRPRSRALAPIMALSGAIAVAGVGLAVAAHVHRRVLHNLPMTAALRGELHFVDGAVGRVAYYMGGVARRGGPPMLLVHGTGAAASSYDMKPVWDHFARSRRMIAIELPGFGFSERGDREYSPSMLRDAIAQVLRAACPGEAADVVAFAQGCEFAALAALQQPKAIRSLSLVSPTGLGGVGVPRARAFALLCSSTLGQIVFDLRTSRPVLRHALRTLRAPANVEALADYAYETSHQPAACFAPFCAMFGLLSTPNIADVYESLAQRCLAIFGSAALSTGAQTNDLLAKANWHAVSIGSPSALVHWDEPRAVMAQIEQHIAERGT